MTFVSHDQTRTTRNSASSSAKPVGAFELRQLGRRDLAAIAALYLSLDEADRVRRFHSPFDDAAIVNYLNGIDFAYMTLIGAADPSSDDLIGIAELHEMGAGEPAQMSLIAAPGSHAEPVSTQLMTQLMDVAATRGADSIVTEFMPSDTATIGLLRAFGATVDMAKGQARLSWTGKAGSTGG